MIEVPDVNKELRRASSAADGLVHFIFVSASAAAFSYFAEDWITGLAVVALWLV